MTAQSAELSEDEVLDQLIMACNHGDVEEIVTHATAWEIPTYVVAQEMLEANWCQEEIARVKRTIEGGRERDIEIHDENKEVRVPSGVGGQVAAAVRARRNSVKVEKENVMNNSNTVVEIETPDTNSNSESKPKLMGVEVWDSTAQILVEQLGEAMQKGLVKKDTQAGMATYLSVASAVFQLDQQAPFSRGLNEILGWRNMPVIRQLLGLGAKVQKARAGSAIEI